MNIVIALVIIVLGAILNSYGGYMWPIAHELILSIMLAAQLTTIKYIIDQLDLLIQCTNDNVVLGCLSKYEQYRDAWGVVPAILLSYAYFAVNISVMGVIPFNALGVYSVFLASFTLVTGVYGYYHYICLLLCLNDIKLCTLSDFPCKQRWFIQLEKLTQKISTLFLVFGLGYIVEFSILTVDYTSNTPQNCIWGLYMVWLGIIFFIILAFPVLVIIRKALLKDIVKRWKRDQINETNICICNLIDTAASSKNNKIVEKQISLYKEKMHSIDELRYDVITGNKISLGVTSTLNILISILTFATQINDLLC